MFSDIAFNWWSVITILLSNEFYILIFTNTLRTLGNKNATKWCEILQVRT